MSDFVVWSDCVVCDERRVLAFTDLHGEAQCVRCSTPYMVAGYNGRTETTCAMRDDVIPVLRTYWSERHVSMGLGTFLGPDREVREARRAFTAWLDEHQDLLPDRVPGTGEDA